MRLRAAALAAIATATVIGALTFSTGTASASGTPTIAADIASQSANVRGVSFTPSGWAYVEIDKGYSGGTKLASTWVQAAGPHWICAGLYCYLDPGGEITWTYNFPPSLCYTIVVVWAWDQTTHQYSNITPPTSTQCA